MRNPSLRFPRTALNERIDGLVIASGVAAVHKAVSGVGSGSRAERGMRYCGVVEKFEKEMNDSLIWEPKESRWS